MRLSPIKAILLGLAIAIVAGGSYAAWRAQNSVQVPALATQSLADAAAQRPVDKTDQVIGNFLSFFTERRERFGQCRLHAVMHAESFK